MGSFRKITEKNIKNEEKRKGYINLFETAFKEEEDDYSKLVEATKVKRRIAVKKSM